VVQLVLNAQQCCLCLTTTAEVIGIGQASIPAGLPLAGEVTNDIAKLATENRTTISTILSRSAPKSFAAIDEIQMELSEVQPAGRQIREQTVTRRLVFPGALMKSKHRFAPCFIDAQRSHEVLLLDFHAVQQQSAQAQFGQIPFEKFVHLPGAHAMNFSLTADFSIVKAFSDSRTVGP
jgi:hypothetical protein